MEFNTLFFINSILLGIGLSMDAFSVSLVNGLNEPKIKPGRMIFVAGVYAVFQGIMPLLGWICIHSIICHFLKFTKYITLIGAALLIFIGNKMLIESWKKNENKKTNFKLTFSLLLIQGLATSIDALSVGFTIGTYNFLMAFIATLIIAAVTEIICFIGLFIGKKVGTKFSNKASLLGGIILILIGIEFILKFFFAK